MQKFCKDCVYRLGHNSLPDSAWICSSPGSNQSIISGDYTSLCKDMRQPFNHCGWEGRSWMRINLEASNAKKYVEVCIRRARKEIQMQGFDVKPNTPVKVTIINKSE